MSQVRLPNPRPIPLDEAAIRRDAARIVAEIHAYAERQVRLGIGSAPDGYTLYRGPLTALAITGTRRLESDVRLVLSRAKSPSVIVGGSASIERGRGNVTLLVNSRYAPVELSQMTEEGVHTRAFEQVLRVLRHELTHVGDWESEQGPRYAADSEGRIAEASLSAYYNDPREVRAFMREIVDDVAAYVDTHRHERFDGWLVEEALAESSRWTRVEPFLSPPNKKKILLAAYRAARDVRPAAAPPTFPPPWWLEDHPDWKRKTNPTRRQESTMSRPAQQQRLTELVQALPVVTRKTVQELLAGTGALAVSPVVARTVMMVFEPAGMMLGANAQVPGPDLATSVLGPVLPYLQGSGVPGFKSEALGDPEAVDEERRAWMAVTCAVTEVLPIGLENAYMPNTPGERVRAVKMLAERLRRAQSTNLLFRERQRLFRARAHPQWVPLSEGAAEASSLLLALNVMFEALRDAVAEARYGLPSGAASLLHGAFRAAENAMVSFQRGVDLSPFARGDQLYASEFQPRPRGLLAKTGGDLVDCVKIVASQTAMTPPFDALTTPWDALRSVLLRMVCLDDICRAHEECREHPELFGKPCFQENVRPWLEYTTVLTPPSAKKAAPRRRKRTAP